MKKYLFSLVLSLFVCFYCFGSEWGTPNYHIHVTAIASPSFICRGDSVRLSSWNCFCGVPPYTYNWTPTAGVRYDAARCTNAAPSHTTTYTITVTDANGVSGTTSVTVHVDSIHVSITGSNICVGSVGYLTAAVSGSNNVPPYTYSWSPSGGTNATATIVSAGTYTVTVTDSNGCSITKSDSIKSSTTITVTDSVASNVTCNGGSNGSAGVGVSGGTPPYTYSWSGGGSNSTKTGMTAGTYTVTLTDGCGASATASVIITQPPPLIVSGDTCLSRFLVGDSLIAVGGTPPYTYSWSPPVSSASLLLLTDTTVFTLTVTDAHGCSSTSHATFIPSPFVASSCENLFISVYISDTVDNNSAIEIYNPAPYAIVLNNYILTGTTNGSLFSPPFIIRLSGSIPAFNRYVVANSHADVALKSLANMLTDTLNFRGKDVVELAYIAPTVSGVVVKLLDKIGDYTIPPTDSGWAVGTGSTKNHTLSRYVSVVEGDPDWTTCQSQWNVYPQGTFSELGHYENVCYPGDAKLYLTLAHDTTICDSGYFEFDIMAAADSTTIFNNCVMDIYYPTKEFLGDSISNGGITVTRGANFQPDSGKNDYDSLHIVNLSDSVIEIKFGSASDSSANGTILDSIAQPLLHIKLKIQNCQTTAVSFIDTAATSHLAYYTLRDSIQIITTDSTETATPVAFYICHCETCPLHCCGTDSSTINCICYCDSNNDTISDVCSLDSTYYLYTIDTIYACHNVTYSITNYSGSITSSSCPPTITNFNSPIDAGIDSILTITGYNFGYPRGTGQVKFYDADSANYLTQGMNIIDYLSWTNNQIQIKLPGFVDSVFATKTNPSHIGGGNFIVTNSCIESATSNLNTNHQLYSVPYSINQDWNPYSHQKTEVLLRKVDTNGGYVFHLDSNSMPHGSNKRLLFAKAMRDWTCFTGIKWTIGKDTTITYNPLYAVGVNYVFFTDTLLLKGVDATTKRWLVHCSDSLNALYEGDIYFNADTSTHFVYDSTGTATIQNGQADYYGVCLHELGHFIELNHSTDRTSLMYWSANTNHILPANRINLSDSTATAAVAGAIYSKEHSVNILGNCGGYSPMVPQYTSCVNPYNGIKELKGTSTFTIYPNPTNGTFTIETNVNEYTLVITNILGQRILSKKIQSEKSIISLSTQANGMYFIQEQYKNGIATQKLIIQK